MRIQKSSANLLLSCIPVSKRAGGAISLPRNLFPSLRNAVKVEAPSPEPEHLWQKPVMWWVSILGVLGKAPQAGDSASGLTELNDVTEGHFRLRMGLLKGFLRRIRLHDKGSVM